VVLSRVTRILKYSQNSQFAYTYENISETTYVRHRIIITIILYRRGLHRPINKLSLHCVCLFVRNYDAAKYLGNWAIYWFVCNGGPYTGKCLWRVD